MTSVAYCKTDPNAEFSTKDVVIENLLTELNKGFCIRDKHCGLILVYWVSGFVQDA